jgi:hypothetical protein
LKGEGFTVDDNNVPYGRDSTWRGVSFLMVHHTVSDCDGSESSIASYCRTGGSGTYPPLCQIVLGHSGKVWMTCKERSGQSDPGRASHAGSGDGYGIPNDTMNERALGIECQCDGTHKIASHSTQYQTLINLLAALCRRYDVPVANIIGHKEWSSTGKVDPRDDMDDIRADVSDQLQDYESGGDTVWTDYSGKPAGELVVANSAGYVAADFATDDPPSGGLEFHLLYANCSLRWSTGNGGAGTIRVKYVREDGDATAYQDYTVTQYGALDDEQEADPDHPADSFLITAQHWESGQKGVGGRWHIRCDGDIDHMRVGTRYAKIGVVS